MSSAASSTLKPIVRMAGRAIRWRDRQVFPSIDWAWLPGQQWAVMGANGSGKSLLALAVAGKAPLEGGEVEYGFSVNPASQPPLPFENEVALLSPDDHRDLALRESSFYQSRWQSGLDEGSRTLADFLSYQEVAEVNPYESGARRRPSPRFLARRRELLDWLGLKDLMQRKLNRLSSGETRKALLVKILLRRPRLLILDDPYGGLDAESRLRLKTALDRLMQAGLAVLLLTSRPDELPDLTTHLLLVKNHRVIAQGARPDMLNHPLARSLTSGPTPTLAMPQLSQRHGKTPNASPGSILEMRHVTIQAGRKLILNDASWIVRPGEHWALLGPNGSGKTTLLSLVQGDHPQAHAVDLKLFGASLHSTSALWKARQKCGWLSPELHLHYPPGWACWQVVCSGYFNSIGLYQSCTSRQRSQARAQLTACHLADRAGEPFGSLSLGDQRMVLLARALVKRPRLLILDEPCQGLDAFHRQALLKEVDRQIQECGASLLFVTHHAREMPACITHVMKMRSGRLQPAPA